MPREPAHKRAPIEIWDTILNIAIISPLLPHPNDDIVDLYLLFTKECESQRIQRTVEGVRTRLRLVCRGWNASLRDKGVKLVIGPFELGKPHRLEQYGKFDCQCGHSCFQPMDGQHPTTVDDSTSIAGKFENLIVFTTNYYRFLIDGTEMAAPCLRALRYECPHFTPRIGHMLQTQTVQDLSHLELAGLSLRAMVPVPGNVNLPRLFVLSLRFTSGRVLSMSASPGPAPVPNTALIDWVLPSLRTLNVEGPISPRFLPAVTDFLSRSWNTVTSLHVRLSFPVPSEYQPFEIEPTFCDSFPNLHTIGFSEATLARNPSPPPVYSELCLVIDSLWDDLHGDIESLARARQILDDWKPCTIILLYSWEEVLGMLRREATIQSMYSVIPPDTTRPSAIFTAAMARNIRLLDVYRVSLFHEDHKECLDLLQNWGAMSGTHAYTGRLSGDGDDETDNDEAVSYAPRLRSGLSECVTGFGFLLDEGYYMINMINVPVHDDTDAVIRIPPKRARTIAPTAFLSASNSAFATLEEEVLPVPFCRRRQRAGGCNGKSTKRGVGVILSKIGDVFPSASGLGVEEKDSEAGPEESEVGKVELALPFPMVTPLHWAFPAASREQGCPEGQQNSKPVQQEIWSADR